MVIAMVRWSIALWEPEALESEDHAAGLCDEAETERLGGENVDVVVKMCVANGTRSIVNECRN